jgi:phospholipase C
VTRSTILQSASLRRARYAVLLAAVLATAACGGSHVSVSGDPAFLPLPQSTPPVLPLNSKVQHIVIIVQENRSVDNLFQGYPGADTQSWGYDLQNHKIPLKPAGLEYQYVIDHSFNAYISACNGSGKIPGTDCRNNGFVAESGSGGPPDREYVYVPQAETKPYFALAHEFVLADETHESHLDESFVGHQYLIAAQANHSVNLPSTDWGCDGGQSDTVQTLTAQRAYGKPEVTCFDYPTLGDSLDKAGLSWRFYTSTINADGGEWSGYQAVHHIRYGPDWAKDIVTPQTQIFDDVSKGILANVTWVTPTCINSDHVNCGGKTGPHWVSTIVNAIGESQFWKTTTIFVIWDDWGGLYDHVKPIYKDYDGIGFRVPMLVISPYAKANYVSHVQYESASILRFAEEIFQLPRLAAADRRAVSPEADCFDFTKPARPYKPVATMYTPEFFKHQPYDGRIPDEQ